LVQSPAASRAALANHRAAIDPALAKMLEIVGGYTCAVILSSLLFLLPPPQNTGPIFEFCASFRLFGTASSHAE
jgi:hypothetical protein